MANGLQNVGIDQNESSGKARLYLLYHKSAKNARRAAGFDTKSASLAKRMPKGLQTVRGFEPRAPCQVLVTSTKKVHHGNP
jgi:hypothetical protein